MRDRGGRGRGPGGLVRVAEPRAHAHARDAGERAAAPAPREVTALPLAWCPGRRRPHPGVVSGVSAVGAAAARETRAGREGDAHADADTRLGGGLVVAAAATRG